MAEMWGIAGGIRNFNQDQLQLQRFALEREEAKNLETHRQAQRVATNTELMQRERRLSMEEGQVEEQRKLEREMARPGEGEDMTTPAGQIRALRDRAARLMDLGKVDDAAKLLNTSAQTLVRLENAARAESERAQNEFTRVGEQTRRLQEALTGVRSKADFDTAKLALAAMPEMEGMLDHEMLREYNPQLISRFIENAPAWVKKRELDLREQNQRSMAALRNARIEFMGFQRGVQSRQVAVAEAREARLEKAGAGAGGGTAGTAGRATPPTENARNEVLKFLKQQELLSTDPGMRALQISSITEDAHTLARRNPGIASFAEAMQIAVENAKARGELSQEVPTLGRPRGMFKQQGGSAARPINLTPGKPMQFVENRHYRDEKGNVALYQGGKFVPVYSANPKQVIQPPTANNPLLDEGEDEGED